MAARSLGRWGNRAAGNALVAMGAPALAGPVKELRAELGLPRLGTREAIFGNQHARHWPGFCGFSPAVVPRPADWRDGLEVAGYWWPERPAGWEPPADLENFLDIGPPPVFIGFGSMTPGDPHRLSGLAAAARRQAGVRMVIQAGQEALDRVGQLTGDAIVIGEVPHDWLFPRMAAVIHHAGAGTAAAGLRAGVPAVSVPDDRRPAILGRAVSNQSSRAVSGGLRSTRTSGIIRRSAPASSSFSEVISVFLKICRLCR